MTHPPMLRRKVVRFLCTDRLEDVDAQETEWMRNLRWLDRSGLALPLAARFEALRPGSRLPAAVRAALRKRLADNQRRMERMLEYFQEAVQVLNDARVRYCCVKGFSLIPDCFDSIRERHQIDLDLLVSGEDLNRARGALEHLGYRVQREDGSGEVRLVRPWKKHLGAHAYLYQLPEPPPIELHTQAWEAGSDEIALPLFWDLHHSTAPHEVCGVEFPRLQPAKHFVYLLLHIFRHLFGSWTRLVSLYEVATFIRARGDSSEIWAEAARIIDTDQVLAAGCSLVLALVNSVFPVDLPAPLRGICGRGLSPESAVWIEQYSTAWLFAEPPGSKLSLLVQDQFWPDRRLWRRYLLRRLFPIQKPHELSVEVERSTRQGLAYKMEEAWYKAGRAWYHVRSDFEYFTAWPSWAWQGHTRAGLQRVADES